MKEKKYMVIQLNIDLDLNMDAQSIDAFEALDVQTQCKMFMDAIDELNKGSKSQISLSYNDELIEKLELMKEMNENG